MRMRKVKVKKGKAEQCPECGNEQVFNIHSTRGGPDFMEVYAQCGDCGFKHTNGFDRYESVWGGTSKRNCSIAMDCWNQACNEMNSNNN